MLFCFIDGPPWYWLKDAITINIKSWLQYQTWPYTSPSLVTGRGVRTAVSGVTPKKKAPALLIKQLNPHSSFTYA
jgi:hypothetical protein